VRRTMSSSVFVENGACRRPLVCVFLCVPYFLQGVLHDLSLTSSFIFSLLAALKRPKLNQDGHNRVLRALHQNVHHYKHYIRPDLLALYSFGPEPSEAVLSLQEINQKSECFSRVKLLILLVGQILSDDVFTLFCRNGDS
jgi:hypothetical protein